MEEGKNIQNDATKILDDGSPSVTGFHSAIFVRSLGPYGYKVAGWDMERQVPYLLPIVPDPAGFRDAENARLGRPPISRSIHGLLWGPGSRPPSPYEPRPSSRHGVPCTSRIPTSLPQLDLRPNSRARTGWSALTARGTSATFLTLGSVPRRLLAGRTRERIRRHWRYDMISDWIWVDFRFS
jgi:hypothetical protein